MNGAARQALIYLGNLGSALPAAMSQHRGHFFWKRAAGAEDELYAGVKDSSGVNQLRRVLTKTYADTLYTTEYFVPAPAAPPGMTVAPATSTTLVSTNSYALYLGRAGAAYTSISTRWDVTTEAQTITWAEVGIGTSPVITLNGNATITRRGYTDVSAAFNSTGEKTVATTVSGISVGDHLWALCGSQATTPFQILASVGGNLSAGNHQRVTARLSTMAAATAFSCISNPAATAIATMWIGT
jgi:hypothetical protein